MKITIESTSRIILIRGEAGGEYTDIPARVWEGTTESGIYVQCLVTRIAAPRAENLEQFERELVEHRPPSVAVQQVFPMRMVL